MNGAVRGALALSALLSAVFFPWPLTAILALASAPLEPLVPLAVGILLDALYFAPESGSIPVLALSGLAVSVAAFFVRSRLLAGTME
ncbi:hypothetical protein HY972_00480 [Candidatus Kaiserbacteria bacterium]|nr:hypothetical protein [Candidatus Kaiserbacteria bacterium]